MPEFRQMKVITIDKDDFGRYCRSLELKCESFRPDLVIGIATGGDYVAEKMFIDIPHASIKLRRPTSESKDASKHLFRILRHLPRPLLDIFRICEAWLLRFRKIDILRDVHIPENLKASIINSHRILVVDDAVDSGGTLKSIVNALNRLKTDNCVVKSAVITVTTDNPVIIPDFYLFANRTLIRFPWSKDMR